MHFTLGSDIFFVRQNQMSFFIAVKTLTMNSDIEQVFHDDITLTRSAMVRRSYKTGHLHANFYALIGLSFLINPRLASLISLSTFWHGQLLNDSFYISLV